MARSSKFMEHLRAAAASAASNIEIPPDVVDDPAPASAPAEPRRPAQESWPAVHESTAVQPCPAPAVPHLIPGERSKEVLVCEGLGPAAVVLLRHLISTNSSHVNLSALSLAYEDGRAIPYTTLRNSWYRIMKLGFIQSKESYTYGSRKGIVFSMEPELRKAFIEVYRVPGAALNAPVANALPDLGEKTVHSSMSFEDHPEFALWRDAGVTEHQQRAWEKQFDIDHELMDVYMKWCAWDVAHREEPIKNISNWFYAILKKSGAYTKPDGYVSIEQQHQIELESLRKEKALILQKQDQLLAKEAEESLTAVFEAMMEEKESNPLYRELYEHLPDLAKTMGKQPGSYPVFRQLMWVELKKKVGM